MLKKVVENNNNKEVNKLITLLNFRYRETGVSDWLTIPVTPSGSTQVTINRLSPSTTYEFQVIGKNALGDGMLSKVITVRTLGK